VVNAISRRDVNSQAQINSQYVTLRLFTVAQQQESWLGAFHLNQQTSPAQSASAAQQSTAAALFFFMLASVIPIHCLGVTSHGSLGLLLRGVVGGSAGSLIEVGLLPILIPKAVLWAIYGFDAHNLTRDLQERDPLLFRRAANLVGMGGCTLVLVLLRLLGLYATGECSTGWYWLQALLGALVVCQVHGTLLEAGLIQFVQLRTVDQPAAASTDADQPDGVVSTRVNLERALVSAVGPVGQSAWYGVRSVADTGQWMLYSIGLSPSLNPVSPWLVHQERLRNLFKVVDWTVRLQDGETAMAEWLTILALVGYADDKQDKSPQALAAQQNNQHHTAAQLAKEQELHRIKALSKTVWQSVNSYQGNVCQNIMEMDFEGCGSLLEILEHVVKYAYNDMRVDNTCIDQIIHKIDNSECSLTLSRGAGLAATLPKLVPPGEMRLRDSDNYFKLQESLCINCEVIEWFPTLYADLLTYSQACLGTYRAWLFHWWSTVPVDSVPLLVCVQLICSQCIPAITSLQPQDDIEASAPQQQQIVLQLIVVYVMLHCLASGLVVLMRIGLLAGGTLPEAVARELYDEGLLDPLSAWYQNNFRAFDLRQLRQGVRDTVVPAWQAVRRMSKLLSTELGDKLPRVARGVSNLRSQLAGYYRSTCQFVQWLTYPVVVSAKAAWTYKLLLVSIACCTVMWHVGLGFAQLQTSDPLTKTVLILLSAGHTPLTRRMMSVSAGLVWGWLVWRYGKPVAAVVNSGAGAMAAHCMVLSLMMALQSSEWFGIVRDAYVLYCALHLADVLGLIRLPWSSSVACPADADVFSSAVPKKLFRRSSSMVTHGSLSRATTSQSDVLSPQSTGLPTPQSETGADSQSEVPFPKPNLYASQVRLSSPVCLSNAKQTS